MRLLLLVALATMGCKDRSKKSKAKPPPTGNGIAILDSSALGIKGIVLTPALVATPMPETSPPLELRFEWKGSCVVPVVATYSHRDGFDEASFDFHVESKDEGYEVEVKKLLVTGRKKVSRIDSYGKKAVGRMILLPPSKVTSSGSYVQPLSVEAFTTQHLQNKFSINPELIKTQDLLPNKAVLIQNSAVKQWDIWIESWLGHSWVPGKFSEEDGKVRSAMGTVPAKIKREHLGHVKGRTDLFLLETSSESKGPAVESQVFSETKELMEARGQKTDMLPEDLMKGYSNERKTTIAVDAKMRPHRVRQEERVTTQGGKVTRVLDTMFEWDKAKGCGP